MQPDAGSPGVRVGRPPRHAECEWPGDADRQLSRWHRAACICANGTPKCAISIGKESCREPWWPQPRDRGRSPRLFNSTTGVVGLVLFTRAVVTLVIGPAPGTTLRQDEKRHKPRNAGL